MGIMHGFGVDASLGNIRVNGRHDVWYRKVTAGDGEEAK